MSDPYSFDQEEERDPINIAIAQQRATVAHVIAANEEDPEKAVRAIQIGRATDTPPVVVAGNLESYEQQHKAAITASLLRNNKYLRQYAEADPINAQVSNDDWGQLDHVVENALGLGAKSVLHKAVEGFKEGFQREELDTETKKLSDMLQQNPLFGDFWLRQTLTSDARDLVGFLRGISGIIQGGSAGIAEAGKQYFGMSDASANRLTRDLLVFANVGMSGQAGLHGLVKPEVKGAIKTAGAVTKAEEAGRPTTGITIQDTAGNVYPPPDYRELLKFINKVEPYLRDGTPPPKGIDPLLDEFYNDLARRDAKALKKLEQSADATETLKREPDTFADFFIKKTTDNQQFGLSAKAAEALYPDPTKPPIPEDNLLGSIPGVAEQLEVARTNGSDVVIPASEWIKLKPELREQLREHLRIREGGTTLNKIKEEAEAKAAEAERSEAEQAPPTRMWKTTATEEAQKILTHYKGNLFDALRSIDSHPFWGREDAINRAADIKNAIIESALPKEIERTLAIEKDFKEREGMSYSQYHGEVFGGKLSHPMGLTDWKEWFDKFKQEELPAPEADITDRHPAPQFLSGDNAIDAVRQQAGLDVVDPLRERKLNLQRVGKRPDVPVELVPLHIFELTNDVGERIGDLRLAEENNGKTLFVDWVGAGERIGEGIKAFISSRPNGFGPRAIRDLLEQIKQEFPNAETIAGSRVTGARVEAAKGQGAGGKAGELVSIPLRGTTVDHLREFAQTVGIDWTKAEGHELQPPSLPPTADLTPTPFKDLGKDLTAVATYTGREAIDHIDPNVFRGISKGLFQFFGERLKEMAGDVTVRVISQAEMDKIVQGGKRDNTPGSYTHDEHQILLSENLFNGVFGLSPEYAAKVTIHELAHAATYRAIKTTPHLQEAVTILMEEADELMKLVSPGERKRYDYAFTNWSEFVAESWSKPGFQDLLAGLPMSPQLAAKLGKLGEKGSIWDAVKDIFRDAMQALWGVRPDQTLLDGILNISSEVEKEIAKRPQLTKPGSEWARENRRPLPPEASPAEQVEPPTTKMKQEELPLAGTTRIEDMQVFKNAAAAGLTGPMLKGILKLVERKWSEDGQRDFDKEKARQARQQTKEWRDNRNEMMKQGQANVLARPDIAADELLRTGTYYGKKFENIKLDPEELTPEQRAAIPERYLATERTAKKNITSKDELASWVGLDTGDILIERLAALDASKEQSGLKGKAYIDRLVVNETDKLMESKYGKLRENIISGAMDVAFNKTQLDYMHEWLVGLAEGNKLELPLSKDNILEGQQALFDKNTVGVIKSKTQSSAAGDAVRGMTEAFIKENPAEALKQLTKQFMATTMAKIAAAFEKHEQKFATLADRLSEPSVKTGGRVVVAQDHVNFAQKYLAQAGFKMERTYADIMDAIQKNESGATTIEGFAEYNRKAGFELDIPDFILDEGQLPRFSEMTNAQATEFMEFVESLNHIGRAVQKIEIEGEAKDYAEWKAEVRETIQQLPLRPRASQGRWLYKVDASLTRIEEMIKDLDLRQELGPLFNAIILPMMRSKSKEFDMITDLSDYFKNVRGKFDGKWRKSLNDTIPNDFIIDAYNALPYDLTRQNLINIMLNWGNPSNRFKFSAGYAAVELGRKATKEEAAAFEAKTKALIDAHATREDWAFVEAMWAPFKKWQGEADTVHRSMSGVSPKWIKGDKVPLGLKAGGGEVDGGYWPVKYDRFTANFDPAEKRAVDPNSPFGPDFFPAATAKNHLKERTRYIDKVDISSSLEQAAGVMQQTIHDISFRDAVSQVARIFRDKDLKKDIIAHYGEEYWDQMMPWLRRVANKNTVDEKSMDFWNDWQRRIRVNLIGHALPLNLRVILSPDVGVPNPKEWAAFEANRSTNKAFAMEHSKEIKHLVYNIDRDFREQLENISVKQAWSPFQRKAVQMGFGPMMAFSQEFRMSTFITKYNEAIGNGHTHQEAVDIGDYNVRLRHGAASTVDLPSVMSSSETWKSLTTFMSFFNAMYQWQRQIPGNVKRGEWSKASVNTLGSVLVGAAFGALLFNDAKESDSWYKIIGKALFLQGFSGVPVAREALNLWLDGHTPRTPTTSLIDAIRATYPEAKRLYQGEEMKHPIKTAGNVLGIATGLPFAQPARTTQFLFDVNQGKQRPKNFVEWWRGIVSGEALLKP